MSLKYYNVTWEIHEEKFSHGDSVVSDGYYVAVTKHSQIITATSKNTCISLIRRSIEGAEKVQAEVYGEV